MLHSTAPSGRHTQPLRLLKPVGSGLVPASPRLLRPEVVAPTGKCGEHTRDATGRLAAPLAA